MCDRFFITASTEVASFRLLCVPNLVGKRVFILCILVFNVGSGDTTLDQSPGAFAASRSIGVTDDGTANFAGPVMFGFRWGFKKLPATWF